MSNTTTKEASAQTNAGQEINPLGSIGLIGVGAIRLGVGNNVVETGYSLRVLTHRQRKAIDNLVERGATEAEGLVDIRRSSPVVTCLPGRNVIEEARGVVHKTAPGAVILDGSTNDPKCARRLGSIADGLVLHLLDGPLGKGLAQAREDRLTVVSRRLFASCTSVRPKTVMTAAIT